ncbi:hypothetical protein Moror_7323 [Moniliophthora roreri MCA 2997]|uniref:Uncharacterized protein n=1 Tax=Moniliophthora roreri (strain MCA 2997) TaxID=1381753 RepID=V2X9W6_MONRO|nr:hypothetical protein Moror_7323 [Moniliophthora roreri MCA 2997]KAI3612248.1 hypothetical protein WG66_012101 [Moniliophthora roreri]
MMEQNNLKRVLTDEIHASNSASNASPSTTTPDYASQIRNRAMHVRRSVAHGFPSSSDPTPSRAKSLSTGHLFRSANDTLRDVTSFYSQNHEASSSVPTSHRKLKRARSSSPQEVDSDIFMVGSLEERESAAIRPDDLSSGSLYLSDRPIKALRKPSARALMQTQSLPASLWPHKNPNDNVIDESNESAAQGQHLDGEEEDWSSLDVGAKPFELMVLS